jgi:hypothetical protein
MKHFFMVLATFLVELFRDSFVSSYTVRLWTAARDIIVSGKCCLHMKKLFVLSSSFYHHFEAVTELEKPKAALFSRLVASLKTWS